MPEAAVVDLTSLQQKILLETYALKGRQKQIQVVRNQKQHQVLMNIGERHLGSDQAVDALSNLYSRGLLHQEGLNRFVLTEAGQQLAKDLTQSKG